jgi:hypothetical protein
MKNMVIIIQKGTLQELPVRSVLCLFLIFLNPRITVLIICYYFRHNGDTILSKGYLQEKGVQTDA